MRRQAVKRDVWIISAIAVFLMLSLGEMSFTQDDAFISLRYAHQLAAGHGFRFNTSDPMPVEGFTNLLWVLLLVVPFKFNLDPIVFMKLAGVVSGALLIYFGAELLERLHFERRWIRIGIWLTAVNATLTSWAVSGLETILFSLFIFLALRSIPRLFSVRDTVFACLAWSMAAVLTRPDGVLVIPVVLTGVFFSSGENTSKRRNMLIYLAGMVIFGAMYAGWKYSYFGMLLPNTYFAKVNSHVSVRLAGGCRYIFGWLVHGMWVPVGLSLVSVIKKRHDPRFWIPALWILVYLCYILGVGGDFMRCNRFMAPIIAPLLIPALSGLRVLHGFLVREKSGFRPGKQIAFFVLLFVYLLSHALIHYRYFTVFDPSDPFQEANQKDTVLAEWMKRTFPHGVRLALYNIGRLSYYTNFETIDTLGLTDREIAMKLRRNDKCGIADVIRRRNPDVIIPQGLMVKCRKTITWQDTLAGDWRGARHTFGICPLLNPYKLRESYRRKCPDIIEWFKDNYEKTVVKIDRFKFVIYLKKTLKKNMRMPVPTRESARGAK